MNVYLSEMEKVANAVTNELGATFRLGKRSPEEIVKHHTSRAAEALARGDLSEAQYHLEHAQLHQRYLDLGPDRK